jgi:hypothetical protein
MVMKKASGGDSPPQQGAGKSFWTLPISRRRWRRLTICFLEKSSGPRVFSSRRIYRRKGDVRGWTSGPHHSLARPGGGPRHGMAWPPSTPLRLCFGFRLVSGKIGTSAFVSSNSENISCVTFLKHKTSENRELALWHLVNKLVLENA